MNVYDRANNVVCYGEMLIRRSEQHGACAEVSVVAREGYAAITLSPEDARRMGEALIELANRSGT